MAFEDESNDNLIEALEETDTFIKNFDKKRSDADVRKYSNLRANHFLVIKNEEDEASLGMDSYSRCDPFSCL